MADATPAPLSDEKRIRIVVDVAALQASVDAANNSLGRIGSGTQLGAVAQQFAQIGTAAQTSLSGIQAANDNLNHFGSGSHLTAVADQFGQVGAAAQGSTAGIHAAATSLNQVAAGPQIGAAAQQFTAVGAAAQGSTAGIHAAGAALDETNAAAGHASGGILSTIVHLGTMTLALAGLGMLTAGIHEMAEAFIEVSDHATEVTARIMSFTHSATDAATAQAQIVAIANETRSALPAVAELYSKIGIQSDHLGMSLGQVSLATKVFSETSKLSGSTTAQQQGAMLQLGEALDIGTLQGRHFIAMTQDNIVFMRLLATSMGTNIGHLKELSTQGKVTSAELTKALTDPTMVAQIEKQFGRLPVSFTDVRTGIHNTLIQLAGDFANGAGINTSLASLYANIAKFGDSAKPTFEKIGVAFKAAFTSFAPLAQAAIAAVGPLFSFVLDNAPAIIQVLKVGVETWIAYRVAMAALGAVDMASAFITQARSLAMFLDLAKGGSGIMGGFKTALTLAAEGFDILKVAIMANPIGFLVAGITAVVGLLYEFRDSIELGGGTMASFGDLMRAVWEQIQGPINTAWTTVKGFFSWIGSEADGAMSTVAGAFDTTFSGFDFSIAGALRMFALWIDGIVGGTQVAFSTISTIWNNFPSFLQMIFANAANLALNKIQDLVNGTIAGINKVIGIANGLGAGMNPLSSVKLTVDTGDFSKKLGAATKGAFQTNAQQGLESVLARAGQIGAARTKVTPKIADAASTPHAADAADDKKDKAAEKRAKEEKAFWQTLQDELVSAGLYGIKLAEFTEEKKLHKILDRDLTDSEKSRVDKMVDEIANEKAITELKKATFETGNKNMLMQQRANGLSDEQSKIEDALDTQRLKALNDGVNINTADYKTWLNKYKTQLLITQELEKQKETLKTANDFAKTYSPVMKNASDLHDISDKKDAFEEAYDAGKLKDSLGNPMSQTVHDAIVKGYDAAALVIKDRPLEILAKVSTTANSILQGNKNNADYEAQKGALASLDLTDDVRERISKEIEAAHIAAMNKVADAAYDDWSTLFTSLATLFGGKIGGAFNKIASGIEAIQANANGTGKGVGASISKLIGQTGTFEQASNDFLRGTSKGIDGLKDVFSADTLGKGVATGLARVEAGSQIGGMVGGLGDALGIKGFSSGASIGGSLGGLTGNPLIAAAASVVGGIISSLFYSPPSSNATFTTNADGAVGVGNVTGTNAQAKSAASGAAGAVITGLQNLAQQLGGTLTGVPNLTIGTFNDKYRVLDNQQTTASLNANNFQMGSNLHNFDGDENAAVQYAITEAISQGVISGLPQIVQKALAALSQDSAVAFAQQWASVTSDFQSLTDPVTAAVEAFTKPLATMRETMVKVGASTEDLTKVDEYRTLKLAELLKTQLSSITAFEKTLNGTDAGVTKLNQLKADQAQFQTYQDQIAAGSSAVNQSDFTSLGQEILGLAKDVYGTSTNEFQSILATLTSATQGLQANVTDAFNAAAAATDPNPTTTDATTAAITAQTAAVVGQQVITNDLLKQLLAAQQAANDNGGSSLNLASLNGAYLGLNLS